MKMKVEVDVAAFSRSMREHQNKVKDSIPACVRQATLHMHNAIKESIARGINAPVAVDTGRFVNSIDFEPIDKNESKVFSDLEYSKFIEYGTSKMQARPHFGNTAKVEKSRVKEVMKAELKY
jgi:HK97 gp10 family phage protein